VDNFFLREYAVGPKSYFGTGLYSQRRTF